MAKLQFKESFTMALGSMRSHKLRTFLTLLGIVIGVLTIIAVVSVIQGLNNYVYTKMSFFGANDFSVQKFSMMGTSLRDFKEQMKRKDLTLAERDIIRANCPTCELVGASTSNRTTVKYGSQSLKDTEIRGVTYLDHEIGSVVELTSGRHLQSQDETNSRPVGVIGADIAEKVFGGLDPIGRWLKVGSRNFQVIGVAKAKGKILGFSQDNFVRIPITTFYKAYGSRRSIAINIHTNSQEEMARAQEEVRTRSRSWRKLRDRRPRRLLLRHVRDVHPVLQDRDVGHLLRHDRRLFDRPRRGRHRHHEHHVRLGLRADEGDRHPHGRRRPPPGHPLPVPHRVGGHLRPRRASSASSSGFSHRPPSSSRGHVHALERRAGFGHPGRWSCPGRSACSSASTRPTGRPSSDPVEALRSEL